MENREVTWQELEQHNKKDDFWVGFEGKVYDVTKWVENHPGGYDMIAFASGRDISNLFYAYHKLNSSKIFGSPQVPLVGNLISNKFPVYPTNTDFYKTLKIRTEKYFADNNIKNTRDLSWFNVFNTFFIFGSMMMCYYIGSYSNFSFPVCAIASLLGGIFHYLSMTHILHDISHNAYSFKNKGLWTTLGYLGEALVGHSMYMWIHRHVYAHHIYTNVAGVDPDIGIYKASPAKPVLPYRAKYIIVPGYIHMWFYILTTFQMQLDDFFSFFRGSMENSKINDTGVEKTSIFLGLKALFYFHRILLPIYLGQSALFAFSMFMLSEFSSGIFFGYFSQISHVSDEREWPTKPNQDWAELQVLTSCDYAQDSYIWTYLSGYLNYQVTHHLFPSIAPHHYPKIMPIVVETCKEFNVPYTEYKSFWECCKRHLNHVKKFEVEMSYETYSITTILGWRGDDK